MLAWLSIGGGQRPGLLQSVKTEKRRMLFFKACGVCVVASGVEVSDDTKKKDECKPTEGDDCSCD